MAQRLLLLAAYALWISPALAAVEWPQFRGPRGDGHADAQHVPTVWSEAEHIVWKAAAPGRGWSSPVVGDGLVWLTTAIEQPADDKQLALARLKYALNPMVKQMSFVGAINLRAVAVDLETGVIKHDVSLFEIRDPAPAHSLNSYASPSPVLDGQRLVCHFGAFGTACLDTSTASVLWKTRLPNDHSVGPGSSPVVFEDRLIVPCDGVESQQVAALDLRNGQPLWTTKRPKMTGVIGDLHKAFSTPLLIEQNGRTQAVSIGAQWVVAYDPATGREIWRVHHGECYSTVPRPIAGLGLVFICTGYTKPELWAIRPDGTGDVSETHVVWRVKKQVPLMTSPILVDDLLYAVTDQGVLTCLEAKTGDVAWQQRIGGNYSASPIYADGKLYFCSREGLTTVVRPGREFQEIGTNQLDGQLMASPVALDNSLFLRTATHLYRIGH
jgi:outer membrane protein assembly factor BamB